MNNKPKLFLFNHILFTLGLVALVISILLTLRIHIIPALILFAISTILLLNGKLVVIDKNLKTVSIFSHILFMPYRKNIFELKNAEAKIFMKSTGDEQFGIDKISSTFFTYDVIYQTRNFRKTLLFITVTKGHAEQMAKFISTELNLTLETKG